MTAIKSTPERTHLLTLTEQQSNILAQAKVKAIQLTNAAKEAKGIYDALLHMVMPPGANHFDEGTMSFYCVAPESPVTRPEGPELVKDEAEVEVERDEDAVVGEASEPATDSDDS